MNSSLKNVDLFDSVTTIGARAFSGCAQLEELTIPDSVTEIGADAFSGLTGLEKLTILCDPAIIPEGSFANLPALKDVTIAKGARFRRACSRKRSDPTYAGCRRDRNRRECLREHGTDDG